MGAYNGSPEDRDSLNDKRQTSRLEESFIALPRSNETLPVCLPFKHILSEFLIAKHPHYPEEEGIFIFGDEERGKKG